MKRLISLFVAALLLFLTGCKNEKKGSSAENADADPVYFDYEISGEEGYDKLTVLLRFRDGDRSASTITLHDPAKVELDGEGFPVDSAGLSGTFYELNKPVESFTGQHTIVFTDFEERTYEETFRFEPLFLAAEIPDTLHREGVSFDLTGIEEGEAVRVIMTDTSFVNDGVNKRVIVENGRAALSIQDLAGLANGPVQLELIKEENRSIEKGTPAGGRLRIRYVVRRSFNLED